MHELLFYLGQTGLLTAAFCGVFIIDYRSRQQPMTMPIYYPALIWAVSVYCSFLFASSLVKGGNELSPEANGFRFLLGIERLAVFISYLRSGKGLQVGTAKVYTVNQIIKYSLIAGFVLVFGWVMYDKLNENGKAVVLLRKDVQQTKQAVAIDTTEARWMRVQVDSLNSQLARANSTITQQAEQLGKANSRIENLVDLLVSLKQYVVKLGARIDRNTTQSIGRQHLTTIPGKQEITPISPSRVK